MVANRLPVRRAPSGWRTATGGLATALRPVIDERGGAWIGWNDEDEDLPRRVDGLSCDLHPIELSRSQVRGYYYGFANRTLWPLFHDLVVQPVIDRRWWRTYREVNQRFAEVIAEVVAAAASPPLLWVHDYHLLLLPSVLRAMTASCPIGFFLHVPFPPPELFGRLPWRERLLDGLLGADVVGFQTARHRDNFVRTVRQFFPAVGSLGDRVALPDGRQVRVVAHPISIEVDEFTALATAEETESELAELRQQFAGRRVFLGVDRLDYTKGIRHRLQSIEMLLERIPSLRRDVTFVQVAVPSRDDVEEYQDLRTQVETEVGRINGRFTEPGQDVPVHYLYRGISRARLAAYYRLADVMCVTPLKDGMNLVAKEFVVVQAATGGAGVLLLSEFAGAILELADDAIRCNPFDVEGLSYLLQAALELDEEDRRARLRRMAETIRRADVFRWVEDELGELRQATRT